MESLLQTLALLTRESSAFDILFLCQFIVRGWNSIYRIQVNMPCQN